MGARHDSRDHIVTMFANLALVQAETRGHGALPLYDGLRGSDDRKQFVPAQVDVVQIAFRQRLDRGLLTAVFLLLLKPFHHDAAPVF